jgi:hypothetical protein
MALETQWSEIYVTPGNLEDLPLNVTADFIIMSEIPAQIALAANLTALVTALTTTVQEIYVVEDNDNPSKTFQTTKYSIDLTNDVRVFRTVEYRYWDALTGEFITPTTVGPAQYFTDGTYQDFCRWCDYPGEKIV